MLEVTPDGRMRIQSREFAVVHRTTLCKVSNRLWVRVLLSSNVHHSAKWVNSSLKNISQHRTVVHLALKEKFSTAASPTRVPQINETPVDNQKYSSNVDAKSETLISSEVPEIISKISVVNKELSTSFPTRLRQRSRIENSNMAILGAIVSFLVVRRCRNHCAVYTACHGRSNIWNLAFSHGASLCRC